MKSIYESSNQQVVALVDLRKKYYVVQLIGRVSGKAYREGLLQVLKHSKESSITKIILNTKELQNNPDLAGTWLASHFIRRFYKIHGDLRLAVVNHRRKIGQFTLAWLQVILKPLRIQFPLRVFENLKEAQGWLLNGDQRQALEEIPGVKNGLKKLGMNKQGEITRFKQFKLNKSRLKFKVRFSPYGKLEPNASPLELPPVPSVKQIRSKIEQLSLRGGLQKSGRKGS